MYSRFTETPTAPLLRKIITQEQLTLAKKESVTLSNSVANLVTRNPRHGSIQNEAMNPISELFEFLKNYPELFAAFLGSDKEQAIKNVQEGARVAGKTLTEDEAEERLRKD